MKKKMPLEKRKENSERYRIFIKQNATQVIIIVNNSYVNICWFHVDSFGAEYLHNDTKQ